MHILFFKHAECTAILISNWKNNTIFTFSNNEKFKQWENLIIQLQPCLQGSIVRTPSPSPLFDYLPRRGRSEKKKGGGSMVQGQVFLKGGGATGTFPT